MLSLNLLYITKNLFAIPTLQPLQQPKRLHLSFTFNFHHSSRLKSVLLLRQQTFRPFRNIHLPRLSIANQFVYSPIVNPHRIYLLSSLTASSKLYSLYLRRSNIEEVLSRQPRLQPNQNVYLHNPILDTSLSRLNLNLPILTSTSDPKYLLISFTLSIMHNEMLATFGACLSVLSGAPLAAMYTCPTVSTLYTLNSSTSWSKAE